MKIIAHVPVEQYGFVSVEFDRSEVPEDIKAPDFVREVYDFTKKAFEPKKAGKSLPKKEWDEFLDEFLWNGGSINDHILNQLDDYQNNFVQEVKRSKKRMAYKVNREEREEVTRIKNLE